MGSSSRSRMERPLVISWKKCSPCDHSVCIPPIWSSSGHKALTSLSPIGQIGRLTQDALQNHPSQPYAVPNHRCGPGRRSADALIPCKPYGGNDATAITSVEANRFRVAPVGLERVRPFHLAHGREHRQTNSEDCGKRSLFLCAIQLGRTLTLDRIVRISPQYMQRYLNVATNLGSLGKPMGTPLAISKESSLLWSRFEILRKTEAEVPSASLHESFDILKARAVDLVGLCHTLNEAELATFRDQDEAR